jgi:hypothetical protein
MSTKNTNYLAAAKAAHTFTIKYWQERLDEMGKSRYWLAQQSGVSEGSLHEYWNNKSNMSFENYCRINGALALRPYLVPAEKDENRMNGIDLN